MAYLTLQKVNLQYNVVSALETAFSQEREPDGECSFHCCKNHRSVSADRRPGAGRVPTLEDQIRQVPSGEPFIPVESPRPRRGAAHIPEEPEELERDTGVPAAHPVRRTAVPGAPHGEEPSGVRAEAVPGTPYAPGGVSPTSPLPIPGPSAVEHAPRVEPVPQAEPVPRPHEVEVAPRAPTGIMDLGYADAERERIERFGELENNMLEHLRNLQDAEERRDQEFREHEDERERIFLDHENERNQEARQRGETIWRGIEDRVQDRLAELPTEAPLPMRPPGEGPLPEGPPDVIRDSAGAPSSAAPHSPAVQPHLEEAVSPAPTQTPLPTIVEPRPESIEPQEYARSIQETVMDASSRHAQKILETVGLEREEMAREREAARAENQRILDELAAERARIDTVHNNQIAELRDQLASTRQELATAQASLEEERQLRITEDTQRRETDREAEQQRTSDLETQLAEVSSNVLQTRDELIRKREQADEQTQHAAQQHGG